MLNVQRQRLDDQNMMRYIEKTCLSKPSRKILTHTHTPQKKTPCRQYTQVIQHHWTLARMMSKGPSNGHYTHSATYSDKDSRQQNAITRFCEMKWRRVQLYFDVLWNLRTWNTVALALSLVHLGSSSEMLQENSRDTFRIPLAIRGGLLDPSIQ